MSNNASAVEENPTVNVRALAEDLRRGGQIPPASSAANLNLVLGSTSDSVILVDGNWRLTYLNPRAVEALGRVVHLELGKKLLDLFAEEAGG